MFNSLSSSKKCFHFVPYIILFIFSVVTAFSLFMNCDDFIWYFVTTNDKLSSFRNPNGRYFSNYLTILLVKYPLFRHFFISLTIMILVLLLARLISFDRNHFGIKICFILSTLLIIPSPVYREVILWISGFTNYFFSITITLVYLYFVFRVLFSNYIFKRYHLFLFPLLAISAGLSVEHIAIYDILLGIFILVILRIKRNKIFIAPFLYLIASAISVFLMFSNNIYINIAKNGDNLATRTFNIDTSDIFQNFLLYIAPGYSKELWVINTIVAISLVIIYLNSSEIKRNSKYTPICMVIAVLYSVYSVLISNVTNIVILNSSMRIKGFEAAFTFLYIVSLAYLLWVFFEGDRKMRLYIYLISTILLTAPFIFISPASPRCFFSEYVFWILFSGELFLAALHCFKFNDVRFMAFLSGAVAVCAAIFILNIELSNKYYNVKRIEYFKEQMEGNKKNDVFIIELPYPDYAYDDFPKSVFFEAELTGEITYFTLIYDYYGIDAYDLDYNDFTFISPYDYNLMMET